MKPAFQPYEGSEPYIFVWYAKEDRERAIPLLDALNRVGYRVWYYRVQAGSRYDDVIARHIMNCAVFMSLLSHASANSPDCYEETNYARYKQKAIIPVYLDAVELPPGLELRLHSIEHMRLSDYSGVEHFALALREEEAFTPCEISN